MSLKSVHGLDIVNLVFEIEGCIKQGREITGQVKGSFFGPLCALWGIGDCMKGLGQKKEHKYEGLCISKKRIYLGELYCRQCRKTA